MDVKDLTVSLNFRHKELSYGRVAVWTSGGKIINLRIYSDEYLG